MEKLYWFTVGFINLIYLSLCIIQMIMEFYYTEILVVIFILIIDFFIITAYYIGCNKLKETSKKI